MGQFRLITANFAATSPSRQEGRYAGRVTPSDSAGAAGFAPSLANGSSLGSIVVAAFNRTNGAGILVEPPQIKFPSSSPATISTFPLAEFSVGMSRQRFPAETSIRGTTMKGTAADARC